jgi:hypothetical protein
MPGIGGVGDNAVNETISSSNLLTSAGALALSLAGAFGTVELNKYAQSEGSFLISTGDPAHPISAIPGTQVALQTQQNSQRMTSAIIVGIGGLLVLLVVLAAVHTPK